VFAFYLSPLGKGFFSQASREKALEVGNFLVKGKLFGGKSD
jgi:hypothetical protein